MPTINIFAKTRKRRIQHHQRNRCCRRNNSTRCPELKNWPPSFWRKQSISWKLRRTTPSSPTPKPPKALKPNPDTVEELDMLKCLKAEIDTVDKAPKWLKLSQGTNYVNYGAGCVYIPDYSPIDTIDEVASASPPDTLNDVSVLIEKLRASRSIYTPYQYHLIAPAQRIILRYSTE